MSNDPKILVEFSAEEIKWLADRMHEEFNRTHQARMILGRQTPENEEKINIVESHKQMTTNLMNRLLDKACDQGFGDL